MNAILIIAHGPLAHALRQCALHVFPDCGASVMAVADFGTRSGSGAVRSQRSAWSMLTPYQ